MKKDTYLVDSINYLRNKGFDSSIILLGILYDKLNNKKLLNEIGFKILNTSGEPLEVAKLIQKYYGK